MWVLGHICTTGHLKAFADIELAAGEGLFELTFPDLVNCHQWGYDACWGIGNDRTGRLIKAHMIADAVIHLGRDWTTPGRKTGWAYRRMGVVSRLYDPFFEEAASNGMLVSPDSPRRDSLRGWAHTMVEYSLDQYLCDTRDLGAVFLALRQTFARLSERLDWVRATVDELGVYTKTPFPEQPLRYVAALTRADEPDEFHLRGLTTKFGLHETPEVLCWLRAIQRHIIEVVGGEEIEAVLAAVSEVLEDPARYHYPVDRLALPDEMPAPAPDAGICRLGDTVS
jgi:hypothetical protein